MRTAVPVLLTVLPVWVCYLVLSTVSPLLDRANLVIPGHVPLPLGRSLGVVFVTWVVGVTAWRMSRRFPRVGLKPLLYTSGLVLVLGHPGTDQLQPFGLKGRPPEPDDQYPSPQDQDA